MTATNHIWRNGARVANSERLKARREALLVVQTMPPQKRPPASPEAIALCREHPNKGWARRYLRARGFPL